MQLQQDRFTDWEPGEATDETVAVELQPGTHRVRAEIVQPNGTIESGPWLPITLLRGRERAVKRSRIFTRQDLLIGIQEFKKEHEYIEAEALLEFEPNAQTRSLFTDNKYIQFNGKVWAIQEFNECSSTSVRLVYVLTPL